MVNLLETNDFKFYPNLLFVIEIEENTKIKNIINHEITLRSLEFILKSKECVFPESIGTKS